MYLPDALTSLVTSNECSFPVRVAGVHMPILGVLKKSDLSIWLMTFRANLIHIRSMRSPYAFRRFLKSGKFFLPAGVQPTSAKAQTRGNAW